MGCEWETMTVEDLIREEVIDIPLDGNHGAIHPKASDFVPKGVPFIMASDMVGGRVDLEGCAFISEQQAKGLRKGFAKAGDVLLSHKATIGRTAILQESEHPFVVLTPQVTYYRVKNSKRLNPRFLKYYFDSEDFQLVLGNWAGSGSTRAYLGITAQRKLPIQLPPITIQDEIVSSMGALDDKIALLRETNATLEAIAQAIFRSWFVDFDPVRAKAEGRDPEGVPPEAAHLFPDTFEDSELGAIPKGWEIGTVDSSFSLTMGQSPPGSTYNEQGDGLPFFQGRTDFGFRFPSNRIFCSEPTRLAAPGDTLVSVRAPVGDVNMARERCCVGRGVAAIRHKSGAKSFTYYAMTAIRKSFEAFNSEGTVFGSIGKKDFHRLSLILAREDIIHAFEELIGPLDDRIAVSEEEINNLSALRDTLLPRLMSGKLRIPDSEEALA